MWRLFGLRGGDDGRDQVPANLGVPGTAHFAVSGAFTIGPAGRQRCQRSLLGAGADGGPALAASGNEMAADRTSLR